MFASSASPRTLLVWVALLGSLVIAPVAHAQRDDRSLTSERPRVRGLIGGGITLPVSLPLADFGVGGGVSLGLEWPQSDYHSLLVRFDYDHLEQSGEFITLAPGEEAGSANLALLRGGVRFQQEDAERPLRRYVEASIGAGFRSLSEAIDTTTAGGRLLFHVMGALAEFERTLISERTRAGMAAAKARGQHLGRTRKITDEDAIWAKLTINSAQISGRRMHQLSEQRRQFASRADVVVGPILDLRDFDPHEGGHVRPHYRGLVVAAVLLGVIFCFGERAASGGPRQRLFRAASPSRAKGWSRRRRASCPGAGMNADVWLNGTNPRWAVGMNESIALSPTPFGRLAPDPYTSRSSR